MAPPRRLPVLQNSAEDDDERPRWHWVPIGVAFALSIWLPVSHVTNWLSSLLVTRLVAGDAFHQTADRVAQLGLWQRIYLQLVLVGLPLLGFTLATGAAGALCGRFGARVQARDAALIGALAGLPAAAFAAIAFGAPFAAAALLLVAPSGALAGYAGGRLGVRLRRKAATRAAPPAAGSAR